MSNSGRRPRNTPRPVRIVLAAITGVHIYRPLADPWFFDTLMRVVVFPGLALKGLWMSQQAPFERPLAGVRSEG